MKRTGEEVGVSPDCYNLPCVQMDPVHLCDEDGSHSLVQRSAVHVDGGTDRQHEACHTLVDSKILFQAAKCDWEGPGAINRQEE